MAPGKIIRLLLGGYFPIVGRLYRRIFVDMDKIVGYMIDYVPNGAVILDVGGGDGLVAQLLLRYRPDVSVILVDIACEIGGFIGEEYKSRVKLYPKTDFRDVDDHFDILFLADVLHHVPEADRDAFLINLGQLAIRKHCRRIILKDIQPGSTKAWLAVLSDHFITGDKTVTLVNRDVISIVGYSLIDACLPDPPNYCLVFDEKTKLSSK